MSAPVLEVRQLQQHFPIRRDWTVRAVEDVSFRIEPGRVFGLVGESGCGKSTVARSVMGLYRLTGGQVFFRGEEISRPEVYRRRQEALRRDMQIIFQDSAAALNPRMTVREIVAEPLRACRMAAGGALERRVVALLEQVGMEAGFAEKRPGELSGGQRQRVAIARAIATDPALIVADEPIASLDLSIQAQILNLFRQLQQERGFSFLFIAHDLSVVRYLCDEVGVMLRGRLVERGETERLFAAPRHPYTQALLSAVPIADPRRERQKRILEYDPETLPPNGALREEAPGHWVYRGD